MAASRDGADPKRLRQITDATGGRTEMVQRPEQLTAAVDRIAEELGRQYQLAYERTGPRDGKRHEIRVEVNALAPACAPVAVRRGLRTW